MSAVPVAAGSRSAWAAVAAFAESDPKGFEALAEELGERPGWGSITINFHDRGKVASLDKRDSRKV